MSALQRQTYSSQFQPLFQPYGGGGSGSNLTLDNLDINEGGFVTFGSSINISTGMRLYKDISGTTFTQIQQATIGDSLTEFAPTVFDEVGNSDRLQVGDLVVYGQGAAFGISDYLSLNGTGSNPGISYGNSTSRTAFADVSGSTFLLNRSTVGPTPVAMDVGGPFAVAPVPTAPAPFDSFLTSPLYPTTAGEEYDVCVKGTIALDSGAPDPTIPDEFVVSVSVGGTGKGTQKYSFNPNYLTFYVRDRLICTSSAPSIVVSVQNIQSGVSTAVYNAALTMADVVRVK